ncbi:MAG: hypothetical protein EON93_02220 [Burkholderiales bacterium]|nr:MAG: hypothetical protein EON93_02220 [Burkholderiales bacterium]
MEANDLLGDLIRSNLIGAAVVAAVLAVRVPLRIAFGARLVYRLWLLVPLSMIAALLPARTVLQVMTTSSSAEMSAPAMSGLPIPSVAGEGVAATVSGADLAALGAAAWLIGALAFASMLIVSQVAFQRGLGRMTRDGDLLRTRATGSGPVVLGVLRPRVVLPSDFEARFSCDEQRLVLEHEQTHCRAGDQLINLGAAILRCICWFNPLMHVAVRYLRLDQELACDAAVIARRPQSRRTYAEAMLKAQFSASAAPIACYWPTRSAALLKQRITALQDETPGRAKRIAGASLLALVGVTTSAGAWAIQPADVVTVTTANDRGASATDDADRDIAQQVGPDQPHGQDRQVRISEERDEVNRVSPGDGTPLIRAVRAGDLARTRDLLRQGALVDKAARGDGNPLINAVRFSGLDMVKLLVEAGADVDAYVPGDETPLINAAYHGDLAVISYLIDHGANPDHAVPTTNFPGDMRSPLSVAANTTVAEYLKSRGARR